MKNLPERIKFVIAESVSDLSAGFEKQSDNVVYECWAKVEQNASSRDFQNFQITNMVSLNIIMRFTPNFTPGAGQNIIWRNRFLTVQGEPDLSEKQYIKFSCSYDPKVIV